MAASRPPRESPERGEEGLTGRRDSGWVGAYRRWSHEREFFRARVIFLSGVLLVVIIYAARDYSARHARTHWRRPLEVALVLLHAGQAAGGGLERAAEAAPGAASATEYGADAGTEPEAEPRGPDRDALDPEALETLVERVPALEQALTREFERYGGGFRPVHFSIFGPAPESVAPPTPSADPGLLEPFRVSYGLWRFARASDSASGLEGSFDGTIYVALSAPRSARRALVEGLGQDGGRIAVTRLELSLDSVDFGLFVVAHELLHLLGAGDRYGADGMALVPDGLGDPEREPLYPQDSVEVMARGRVLEPGREKPPSDLDELRVGRRTATEIGWLPAAPAP
jgi:hypothetical protein